MGPRPITASHLESYHVMNVTSLYFMSAACCRRLDHVYTTYVVVLLSTRTSQCIVSNSADAVIHADTPRQVLQRVEHGPGEIWPIWQPPSPSPSPPQSSSDARRTSSACAWPGTHLWYRSTSAATHSQSFLPVVCNSAI